MRTDYNPQYNSKIDAVGLWSLGDGEIELHNVSIFCPYEEGSNGIRNIGQANISIDNSIIYRGNNCIFNDIDKFGSIKITNTCLWNSPGSAVQGCDPSVLKRTTTNRNGTRTDAFGNIFVDPQFVSGADFHLSDNSPVIGAGSPEGAPAFDIEGNPRGYPPDMGAYEHPYNWPGSPVGVDDEETTPAPFALGLPRPNPFNPSTVIPFTLDTESRVTLAVYNLLGERIEVLAEDAIHSAGNHEIIWNASGHASGVYLVRLESDGNTEVRKALLVK